MAKRFRLRISRVISTTLQSCRSKNPSNLPEDPVPSFSAHKIHAAQSSFNPRAPSAFIPFAASSSDKRNADESLNLMNSPEFKWRKEDKWHVVARIYENPAPHGKKSDSPVPLAAPPPAPPPSSDEKRKRRGKRNKKKINVPSRLRLSTSSADSGWFSSEGATGGAACWEENPGEETETLVSSSTDSSSELNPNSQLQPIRETKPFAGTLPHRRTKKRISRRTRRANSDPSSTAEAETPARLSVFKKLIPCTVEGKVKESYAIVKRSEDPYEDFRNSMVDMILGKQMFDPGDLEQLLQCFLSLNSRHYHGVIVEAFSEIWNAIFSPSGDRNPRRAPRTASF